MNPAKNPIRLLAAAALLLPLLPLHAQAQEPPQDPVAAEPAAAEPTAVEPVQVADDAVSDAVAAEVVPSTVGPEDVRRFVAVFRAVQQAYVDPVDETALMQAAIRGLLTDLDPHSSYLDEDDASALNEAASGAYDGLGLEVLQQPDRTLLVVSPIDGTPAARAGIRPGDVITAIDGVAITADNVEQAVGSMRGAPGTPIRLTLVREDRDAPIEVTLIRETIRVASVRVEMLEPGYGYARIATFQADSGSELKRKLRDLRGDRGETPLRGLVLDLRSNPGGLVNAAVEIADLFLEQGVIVSTRGRLPVANAIFRAAPGDVLDGAPIAVLTDAGTASAAEILAGALRDQRRAVVMGSVSFGKGSVQTLLPLDNGDAIKVTTARYYTPNGTSIQAAGIVPDIRIAEDLELTTRDRPPTLREADLRGHLSNENGSPQGIVPAPAIATGDDPAEEDFAVREALNLLKGLAIFQQRAAADEEG